MDAIKTKDKKVGIGGINCPCCRGCNSKQAAKNRVHKRRRTKDKLVCKAPVPMDE